MNSNPPDRPTPGDTPDDCPKDPKPNDDSDLGDEGRLAPEPPPKESAQPNEPGAASNGGPTPPNDEFLAPLEDLADPDVFNPAVSPGFEMKHFDRESLGPTPYDQESLWRAERVEVSRIAALIAVKKPVPMREAAAAIRNLRQRGSEGIRHHITELVAIWRLMRQEMERAAPCHIDIGLPYDATEISSPGVVVPSRSAQLGGQTEPLPPAAVVERWLGQVFADEDAVRQFCCFSFLENEEGVRLQPLAWFHGTPVPGSVIARIYRERRIARPWDPDRDPEIALVHDFMLVVTVIGKGRWTTQIAQKSMPRLRPYLRSIPDEMLMPTAASATGFLEGRGLLFQSSPRSWKISPAGFWLFDKSISPVWLDAARPPTKPPRADG